jgi:hypothetical protein
MIVPISFDQMLDAVKEHDNYIQCMANSEEVRECHSETQFLLLNMEKAGHRSEGIQGDHNHDSLQQIDDDEFSYPTQLTPRRPASKPSALTYQLHGFELACAWGFSQVTVEALGA